MRAKESVENLAAYSAPLEGRRGKLRLDFNENAVGPSPRVVEAIRALTPEDYATYPEYGPIRAEFAAAYGLPVQQVELFNGADAAVRAVFDTFGEAGTTYLSASPTFGYYEPCARLQGMTVRHVPHNPDLSYPKLGIEQALQESPKLLFICNPNNPTTTLLDAETILDWAKRFPGTLFVVDEIYHDFTGVTVLPDSLTIENVLVLRSLSKTAGLAALRMGFAIGSPYVLDRLARVTGPYDVNMFAVVAARAALTDPEYRDRYIKDVLAAREYTLGALTERGQRLFCQGGNYLLVWPTKPLGAVVSGLEDRGIRVRSMAGKQLIDGSFRLTVGTQEQMHRFIETYDEVLATTP